MTIHSNISVVSKAPTVSSPLAGPLAGLLKTVSTYCNNCGLCQQHCAFLKHYGMPKEIADTCTSLDKDIAAMAFSCNLCELCTAICPRGLNPSALFLEMRREAVIRGKGDFSAHKRLLKYEARGISPRYTLTDLPQDCDTVFFPGCTLPGTRPNQTLKTFTELKKHLPALGIVLDCCAKPSHDLGRMAYFSETFDALKTRLLLLGIHSILVACPNCYKVFKQYGAPLHVTSIYEVLAEKGFAVTAGNHGTAAIHDPCAVRFDTALHTAVRHLAKRAGVRLVEMPHHGTHTLCCSEGGAASCLSPDLSRSWAQKVNRQANKTPLITYCAGCAATLSDVTPARHLLDVLWDTGAGCAGRFRVSKPPMTYWNRLRLKWRLSR